VVDPGSLTAWLPSLPADRRRRLGSYAGLPAGRISEPKAMAARLSQHDMVVRGIESLDSFAAALFEALLVQPDCTRQDLDVLVGDAATAAQVDAGLERLADLALAWPTATD